jgi:hypothetical protein
MRKSIFIVILCLVGISEMNAQVTFTPGIRGGLNLSNITQTYGDFAPDFYVGAFGAVNFTKRYTLQTEINYSRQGADNVKVDYYDYFYGNNVEGRQNVEINYLSLSMMNKFFIVNGFHIMVGPTLDFVLSDNLIYSYSDVDLGVNAGLGYRFPNGISVEARFKKGIVDVLDSGYYTGNSYFWGDWNTNNVLQLGVSYEINLKSKKE